jgi:hypothetical protein
MPVLRRATDHLRHNRACTVSQSTTKTTKDRSMTQAPDMTKSAPIRRRRHLRTHHDAPIQLSTWKEFVTPKKYRAYRQNACKADPALSLTGLVQRVCQIGSEAGPPAKSP